MAAVHFPFSLSEQESVRFTVYNSLWLLFEPDSCKGKRGIELLPCTPAREVGSCFVPRATRVAATPKPTSKFKRKQEPSFSCAPAGLIASSPYCVDLVLPSSLCVCWPPGHTRLATWETSSAGTSFDTSTCPSRSSR